VEGESRTPTTNRAGSGDMTAASSDNSAVPIVPLNTKKQMPACTKDGQVSCYILCYILSVCVFGFQLTYILARTQICWFRAKVNKCFSGNGQECFNEGLTFLNLPEIEHAPSGTALSVEALGPPPGPAGGCVCLFISTGSDPGFFDKFFQ
jgi:hypothetical protein